MFGKDGEFCGLLTFLTMAEAGKIFLPASAIYFVIHIKRVAEQ